MLVLMLYTMIVLLECRFMWKIINWMRRTTYPHAIVSSCDADSYGSWDYFEHLLITKMCTLIHSLLNWIQEFQNQPLIQLVLVSCGFERFGSVRFVLKTVNKKTLSSNAQTSGCRNINSVWKLMWWVNDKTILPHTLLSICQFFYSSSSFSVWWI